MASDQIRLVYPLAEEMARSFAQGAEQLQDTSQEMQNIANALEEGALLGSGGAAFSDAIRSKLAPALARLIEKFQELEGDVQAAISAMREADSDSQGKFG